MTYESPVGPLTVVGGLAGLFGIHFPGQPTPRGAPAEPPPLLRVTAKQLDEYFGGARREFDVALDLRGSRFQLAVWRELTRIPYGTTIAYKELAARVGRPDQVRAVAGAVARTPAPIVVPCHRVVAVDGALTGYAGGLERKRALLDLEARVAAALEPQAGRAPQQTVLL